MKKYYGKSLGYIFLAIVIFITVASSIFIKSVYVDYQKPFAFTYFNYSFLIILIFVHFIKTKLLKSFNQEEEHITNSDEEKDLIDSNVNNLTDNNQNKKISIYAIILLTFLWYFANAFYNLGLSYDNISFSNTLSNMSTIFILLEKITCFKGKCSIYKVLGVISAFSGLVFITIYQKSNSNESFLNNESLKGDIFILLGSLFYSFYAVFLHHFSKIYTNFDMMFSFGLIGLFNFILVPFVLVILHFVNLESFQFPDWIIIGKIFLNALIASLISDLLQSYSLILLAPHIVSFGLILTIPISITYDFFFPEKDKELKLDLFFFIGTFLLTVSFLIVVYESYLKIKAKRDKELNHQKEKVEKLNSTY